MSSRLEPLLQHPLVFDDGGFPTTRPDGNGRRIPFIVYERLLELAERADIVIPIACTACFLDIENISGLGLANPEADRIIKFLGKNSDKLPTWSHGLTHRQNGGFCEFGTYDNSVVPPETQALHMRLSQQILEYSGLGEATVLVPPSHCWEWGVTDEIASHHGFKAIAARQFEKSEFYDWMVHPTIPYKMVWEPSQHIETFFRLGIGVPADCLGLGRLMALKASVYEMPKHLRYAIHRRRTGIVPPHHYFAHVQNLVDRWHPERWLDLIDRIRS